jgi:spermidine/putrescine transport system substrate-binding protein
MTRSARRIDIARRDFLRKTGVAVVTIGATPSILAACGGDDGAGDAPSPATPAASPEAPDASGTLNFLSWEGYDIPVDSMEAWREEQGIEVNPTYIANHDEIQAKIKGGGAAAGYDLITYYQGYMPLYTELDILTPLDENKLPNLSGLFPFWASDVNNFWIDPEGQRIGVPWTWGSIGLTYNSAEVDEMSSWYDLLDPSLKGKVATVDDPAGNFNLCCKILDLQSNEVPKDRLTDIVDLMSQFVAQGRGVSPSFGDMTTKLVSGDAVACFHGWAAMNTFAADQGVDTIETNIPEEGSHSFCDSYAIPPTSENPDAALAWINQSLDPVVNAEAAEYLVGGVTVEASVANLNKATRDLYPYDDLDGLLELAPLAINAPTESDEFVTFPEWNEAFQGIKAGA